jgi:hypothetical protein
MAKLTITGVIGFDGEYEADFSYFTNRGLHQIKKETDLRAGEFQEAFEAGDNDIATAFAVIMLKRQGYDNAGALWDAPAGTFEFAFDDEPVEGEGGDALPPEPAAVTEPDTGHGDAESNGSSGETSPSTSALPVSVPSLTGLPPLDIGAL